MGQHIEGILQMIEEIRRESRIDRKVELLLRLNASLPESMRLEIPSLITNDYINFALYKIEERLLVA
jgi:hypothetical protein